MSWWYLSLSDFFKLKIKIVGGIWTQFHQNINSTAAALSTMLRRLLLNNTERLKATVCSYILQGLTSFTLGLFYDNFSYKPRVLKVVF